MLDFLKRLLGLHVDQSDDYSINCESEQCDQSRQYDVGCEWNEAPKLKRAMIQYYQNLRWPDRSELKYTSKHYKLCDDIINYLIDHKDTIVDVTDYQSIDGNVSSDGSGRDNVAWLCLKDTTKDLNVMYYVWIANFPYALCAKLYVFNSNGQPEIQIDNKRPSYKNIERFIDCFASWRWDVHDDNQYYNDVMLSKFRNLTAINDENAPK